MKHQSRRHFIRNSLAAGVGVAGFVSGQGLLAHPTAPHLDFPTQPRRRLAVSSWPFRAYIESPTNQSRDARLPGMDLRDFPAMVVNTFGLYNVELLADHFSRTSKGYVYSLRKAVEKAGVHIVDIPVGSKGSFYAPSPGERREAVNYAKQWVDIAVEVGAPSVRVHIARAPGAAPDADRAAESLTALAAYGAGRNVVVNLENDSLVSEDAFFIVRVIDKVQNPYLHALPDFANSMLSGDASFNYDALALLFRHAYNICHMKDSEVGSHGKLYTVNVERIFKIAEASGYRGYYSLEWEGRSGPYEGTRKLLEESLKHLT